jgi:transcriptional regulator with XRE-family HTH domain
LITSGQIRAARAMIRWSAADLASAAGIGSATIKRMEVMEGVPSGNVKTLLALKAALEAAGVEFVGTPEDRPGVRLVGNTKHN